MQPRLTVLLLLLLALPRTSSLAGRGGGPATRGQGRGATAKRKFVPLSPAANKARKAAARAAQIKEMDKKLEGDARFFWECVSKHQGGGVVAGASGLVPTIRDASHLFKPAGERSEGGGIDFKQYDAIPVTRSGAGADEAEVPPLASFEDAAAALPSWTCDNLLGAERMAYNAPTPIQRHAVPLALAEHDLIACAQTGSGKTTAFLLPLLARVAGRESALDPEQLFEAALAQTSSRSDAVAATGKGARHPSDGWRLSKKDEAAMRARGTPAKPTALVLAPTRELAIQIELECAKLTFEAPPPPSGATHWSACAYGGATARPQLEMLAAGVEILVATPGRLADFVSRDLVSLRDVRFLVLDEADRMLDMGFAPQIERICRLLPPKSERQTLMFSATFAPPIQKVAAEYLRDDSHTARIEVGRVGSSMKSITQKLILAEGGDKRSKLSLLKPILRKERTIVFCGKKHVAKWVSQQLGKDGTRAVEIHGDRSQGQREAALKAFKGGEVDVLVATDVASRGIDVPDVQHVIQFDLPTTDADFDAYVHRIGRTGRAGKSGRATSLFVPGDEPKIGNSDLWAPLARLLDENGQEVPQWFDEIRPRNAQPRKVVVQKREAAGLPAKEPSQRRKGASNNRRARRAAAAAAAGRPPNAGPPRDGGA